MPILRNLVKLFPLLLLASASVKAQPTIQFGGVVNAAANAPDGLTNSGIAQGSIFLINGSNLGADNPAPINLLQNTTFPLPTSQGLNGTSVQVNSGGRAVSAIMLYESATQLAAILPSATPLGAATVTVTYNGQSSAPATLRVVQRAFGVFSINQTGYGPGYILNLASNASPVVNRVSHSAQPGQTVALVGTGLGPVSGDESQAIFSGSLAQQLGLQIFVGPQAGLYLPASNYAGRDSGAAGIDEISFQVPPGIQGCYVPVTVVLNGVTSNITTMSISSQGDVCSEQNIGLSAADLQGMIGNNSARVANVTVTRTLLTVTGPNGQLQAQGDVGSATFLNMTPNQFVGAPPFNNPTPGGCLVQTFTGSVPPPATVGAPMDAGPVLNVNGPAGVQQLAVSSDGTSYSGQFGSAFLEPGAFTLDDGGGGSSDTAVGPFQSTVNSPPPFTFNALSSYAVIPKTIPLLITWRGGDPNSVVVIQVGSNDLTNTFGVLVTCAERASVGNFTVPNYVLSWLPVNSIANSYLAVRDVVQSRFSAPGLDAGYFTFQIGAAINTQITASAAAKF